MKCRNCGAEMTPQDRKCKSCGTPADRIVRVRLTPQEAKQGCQKMINDPGFARPIKINIRPEARHGLQLLVNNVLLLDDYGNTLVGRVRVIVQIPESGVPVKKKKHGLPVGLVIGALAVLICAIALVIILILPKDGPGEPSVGTDGTGGHQSTSEGEGLVSYDSAYKIPHFEDRYFLSQLDKKMDANFRCMYDSVMDFQPSCQLPNPVTEEEFSTLLSLLKYECPEMMQMDITQEITYYTQQDTGLVVSVDWAYSLTEAEYQEQLKACQQVVDALVLTAGDAPEWIREKMAFDFIVQSCLYVRRGDNAGSAYGALVEKEAKCDGLSLALKWILEDMGIPSFCLYGMPLDGSNIGHAWNVCKIDGVYYDVDVTADVRKQASTDPVMYQALNVSDTWVRSLYQLDEDLEYFKDIPGSKTMENSYHNILGFFVPADANLEPILTAAFYSAALDGQGYFIMQFEVTADFENFMDNLNDLMEDQMKKQEVASLSWDTKFYENYRVAFVKVQK